MNNPLVSIIIPTYYNQNMLEKCLISIKHQTYKNIEIIIVDNHSTDNTINIAKKYTKKVFIEGPDQSKGRVFGAPFQRNFGFKKAKGDFLYYVDADMELPTGLIEECINIVNTTNAKAIIIAEESFGEGFWAKCKWLERRTYWGDDIIEAPRFFEKKALKEIGYLDDTVGADDWDLAIRLREKGELIERTKNYIMHNEGKLTLLKLMKKRFLYGKDIFKFKKKHGNKKFYTYFTPIRPAYLRNIKLFIKHPILFLGFIYMRFCEYLAGGTGIIFSLLKK